MSDGAAILMSIPEIDGSSTLVGFDPEKGENSDHTGWLPVLSCGFSLERNSTALDQEGDDDVEEVGVRLVPEKLTVKRVADYSTAMIMMWLANASGEGRKKETVLIDYVMPSGRYYLRYELSGVDLVECTLSYQEPAEVTETLKLTYERVRILQRPVGEDGAVDVSKETTAEFVVVES